MKGTIKRKIVYGVIYIGVSIAFPDLPLNGLKFIKGVFFGIGAGAKEHAVNDTKEKIDEVVGDVKESVHDFLDFLNPFN